MIRKTISRSTFQEHLITLIRDELAIEAIKDDGIYSTFEFNHHCLKNTGMLKVNLYYGKRSEVCDPWQPVFKIIWFKDCPELGDARFPYISPETMKNVTDRIKMDMVKKDNAIWSTIELEPFYDHFNVSYERVHVNKPMTAQEMEIENTKRTLRRIQENSYYGLYPRHAGLTCYFDEKLKEDIKASLKTWKTKAEACDSAAKCLGFADAETLRRISEKFSYGSHNKEEKEKKDMNVTLMVVPNGMNKDFVNKVKANFQSNNSQRLFISSVDIDYSSEHEPIKTKYDLFENWITTGKVDVIYFMLGFEKDPDVRAFESFVRGITELSMKTVVNVVYQKDDIFNDVNRLRTVYFDEADAKEDAARATGLVAKEAKAMTEVYSLDDECLEAIKNSKGQIKTSEGLVMDKIMDVAFAEEDKSKKGGKK